MTFSLDEIARYERQIQLPEWGASGQERVRDGSLAVIGRGVAAEMAIRYLAGAGVGTLDVETFVDQARAINHHVAVRLSVADSSSEHGVGNPVAVRLRRDGTLVEIVGADDRAATGAAVAVEALKLLLGFPFLPYVQLPAIP